MADVAAPVETQMVAPIEEAGVSQSMQDMAESGATEPAIEGEMADQPVEMADESADEL
jgi:hypothetical protein